MPTPQHARIAPSVQVNVIPAERPFSNYRYVDDNFPGANPLQRIMSQARSHRIKTIVVERLGEANDIREENDDIRKRYPHFQDGGVTRLSFFNKKLAEPADVRAATDDDFIGYAILKTNESPSRGARTRVYESAIRPSLHANNYIHGAPTWECSINGKPFRVQGYLYAQQNNLTTCCAHVALRTAAARFHPNGDMTYREMNNLLGIDHVSRKVGGPDGDGLTRKEMCRILEAAGARCFVGDYSDPVGTPQPAPFYKYLYGSIESGYPAIVFFRTASDSYHTIPVFGHTFNEDTWAPNADYAYFKVGARTRYIASDSWLSTFIVHDDNWGSNYCIPSRYLYTKRICDPWPAGPVPCQVESDCVVYVIATVPRDVVVSPLRAEVIGADYFFTILPQLPDYDPEWKRRLLQYAKDSQLVLRPILLELSDYLSHLGKVTDWTRKPVSSSITEGLKVLPYKKVWMIEVSIPELFARNRRKVGEVIIRSDCEPKHERDFDSFLFARLPGCVAHYVGGAPANPQYEFVASGADSHVELYNCEETR